MFIGIFRYYLPLDQQLLTILLHWMIYCLIEFLHIITLLQKMYFKAEASRTKSSDLVQFLLSCKYWITGTDLSQAG